MSRLIMAAILMLSAFAATVQAQQKVFNDNQNKTNMESNTIRLTIEGGRTFTATLVDNSSTQALKEQLAKGNITVEMEDYRPTTTGPGDIILYQGHNLVIYYDTNSWSFTRLGKINNASQASVQLC